MKEICESTGKLLPAENEFLPVEHQDGTPLSYGGSGSPLFVYNLTGEFCPVWLGMNARICDLDKNIILAIPFQRSINVDGTDMTISEAIDNNMVKMADEQRMEQLTQLEGHSLPQDTKESVMKQKAGLARTYHDIKRRIDRLTEELINFKLRPRSTKLTPRNDLFYVILFLGLLEESIKNNDDKLSWIDIFKNYFPSKYNLIESHGKKHFWSAQEKGVSVFKKQLGGILSPAANILAMIICKIASEYKKVKEHDKKSNFLIDFGFSLGSSNGKDTNHVMVTNDFTSSHFHFYPETADTRTNHTTIEWPLFALEIMEKQSWINTNYLEVETKRVADYKALKKRVLELFSEKNIDDGRGGY